MKKVVTVQDTSACVYVEGQPTQKKGAPTAALQHGPRAAAVAAAYVWLTGCGEAVASNASNQISIHLLP